MITCTSIMPNLPEITFKFTEDMNVILKETETFAKLQSLQAGIYLREHMECKELLIKYNVEGEIYEWKCLSNRGKGTETALKILQKELLYILATECHKRQSE